MMAEENKSRSETEVVALRSGKELFQATAEFTQESRGRSWWYVISTLFALLMFLTLAALAPWWPVRLASAILGGLVMVRLFILYHDYMHGALLTNSVFASAIFRTIGWLMLTPPRHWRYTHNYHHANVGKIIITSPQKFPVLTSDVGSFPLMSVEHTH